MQVIDLRTLVRVHHPRGAGHLSHQIEKVTSCEFARTPEVRKVQR